MTGSLCRPVDRDLTDDGGSTGNAIEANGPDFVKETREILFRLAIRMTKENDELYPLVDACGG